MQNAQSELCRAVFWDVQVQEALHLFLHRPQLRSGNGEGSSKSNRWINIQISFFVPFVQICLFQSGFAFRRQDPESSVCSCSTL